MNAIAAGLLGGIAGGIGQLLQFADVADFRIDRQPADADAYAVRFYVPVKAKFFDAFTNGLGDTPGNVGRALPENNAKFIATKTADDIVVADTVQEKLTDAAQQLIAGGMPGGVVYDLELIEIHEHQVAVFSGFVAAFPRTL